MDMVKIEQVIVGSETTSSSAEIKTEIKTEVKTEPEDDPVPPVPPLPSYEHENLQCFQCLITFTDPKAKERHMRKSHRQQYIKQLQQDKTMFTCYNCDKSFSSSEKLSEHMATHRTNEKSFQCQFCKKRFFTFTERTYHRRWDCAERQIPCKDCGAFFPNPSRLQYHRISMHLHPPVPVMNKNIKTYQCTKCSRYFQTEEELLYHQEKFANSLKCHKKPGPKPKGDPPEASSKSKKSKQQQETGGCSSKERLHELQIPCPEDGCDLIFPSLGALRAHKRERHGRLPRKARAQTSQ